MDAIRDSLDNDEEKVSRLFDRENTRFVNMVIFLFGCWEMLFDKAINCI